MFRINDGFLPLFTENVTSSALIFFSGPSAINVIISLLSQLLGWETDTIPLIIFTSKFEFPSKLQFIFWFKLQNKNVNLF